MTRCTTAFYILAFIGIQLLPQLYALLAVADGHYALIVFSVHSLLVLLFALGCFIGVLTAPRYKRSHLLRLILGAGCTYMGLSDMIKIRKDTEQSIVVHYTGAFAVRHHLARPAQLTISTLPTLSIPLSKRTGHSLNDKKTVHITYWKHSGIALCISAE